MQPGFLERLMLWQKFLILGALGLLLAGPPLALFVADSSASLEITLAERSGIGPGRGALALLRELQWQPASSAVEAQLTQLDSTFGPLRNALAPQLLRLRSDWQGHVSPARLGEDVATLLEQSADQSQLSLDPVADAYQLHRSIYFDLPRFLLDLRALRAMGAELLSSGRLDAVGRNQLFGLVSAVEQSSLRLHRTLDKAIHANPSLGPPLAALAAAAASDAEAAAALAREQIATAERLNYPRRAYEQALQRTAERQFILADGVLTELDRLLVLRSEEQRGRRNLLLLGVGLITLLTVLCGYRVAHSILRPIRQAVATAQAVADGNLDYRIDMETGAAGGNETGQLLAALTHMQGELKSTIAAHLESERQFREASLEAQAANRAKSEFLARMSHEIRTPMNAVIGMSELALKSAADPRQRNYLGKIHSAGQSLLLLINDILDFSKIEAGKLTLEAVPFRLADVLDNLCSLILLKTEHKGIEVILHVAPDVPPCLVGDPLRLGQVLTNLAGNAAKFTEQGEIVIEAGLERMEHDTALLAFSVRDTGIGMDEKQLAGLFQPFKQGDGSITRKYGGTGLGLAICKHLVELMGGEILVDSRKGEGSRFTCRVPLTVADAPPEPAAAALTEALGSASVLVVDDNASAREVMLEMLASLGLHALEAESGPAALHLLAQASEQGQDIGVVLMDWRMPGMDGIETARCIRQDARLARMPAILMVTAYSGVELKLAAESVKLDGILTKPVSPSLLYNCLNATLHGAAASTLPLAEAGRRTEFALLSGVRVLLVEDNPVNREVALDFLTEVAAEVDVAGNGLEAVAKVREGDYDVVLMDIQMPELDGLSAARRIRSMPGYQSLPIVAMTAHAMQGDREISLAAGMNDHLTKPIESGVLYNTLLRWVDKERLATRRSRSPATASPRAEEAPAEGPLPPVSGLDWEVALARVEHRRALLGRLVRTFLADYDDAAGAFLYYAEEQRFDALQRLAHGLKSAAAYLGAEQLATHARELEQALKQGKPEEALAGVPPLVKELEMLLSGLARWESHLEEAHVPMAGARVSELLRELDSLLAADDARAADALAALRAELADTASLRALTAIRLAIDDIEYRTARQELGKLARAQGVVLGAIGGQGDV
jgi:signal transduction histidine kinase/DNA-binding response OmpR family regulator/HPt (histidine-containing phosphotransfer) domain-containing protein